MGHCRTEVSLLVGVQRPKAFKVRVHEVLGVRFQGSGFGAPKRV